MILQEISLEEVWKIRQEVFWPEKPLEFIQLENDHNALHLGLMAPDLISVVSLFKEGTDMQFRKLATRKEYQGKGFGTKLMREIIQKAQKEGYNRIWCNARVSKKSFYEKFDMKETGQYFSKDGIEFTIMEIQINSLK